MKNDKATEDCVLMLLDDDDSTNAKVIEKKLGRLYFDYFKIITN